ncbi:undecaprenyl-diphosphooligosaccharide--protein glycotransferase [Deferribacterales bacterium RsTz2092]|nr:undecaprenyl-diphosphooligosaccharide--protein glycotransferase [Deferribacterales bacterium]
MSKLERYVSVLIFVFVVFAACSSAYMSRHAQYTKYWKNYTDSYYQGDVPMVSTLDAYYWARHAEEYRAGAYDNMSNDELMYYPDGIRVKKPAPMLVVMLAKLMPFFGENVYEAGLWLIPILAGLFIVPFAVYFYIVGYPVAGIVGGVLAAFGGMYYMRTGPGRIDTDSLNLLFPFLISMFILLASRADKKHLLFIFSALAGLSQLLFYWWYEHALFLLLFLGTLAVSLFVSRKHNIRDIIISVVVFILFANPLLLGEAAENLLALMKVYLFSQDNIAGGYPNVYKTITEVRNLSANEIFNSFFHPVVFFIALAGFVLLCVRNIKQMVPALPIFVMGVMVLFSSMRFVMYLIPFLGAGLGYLINIAADRLPLRNIIFKRVLGYLAGVMLIAVVAAVPNRSFVFFAQPNVSIPPQLYRTFNVMRNTLPEGAAVYTWWDFGLAIEAQAKLATFHDGMSQNSLKTWLIARSFISEQSTASNIIRYLANNGIKDVLARVDDGESASSIIELAETYAAPLEKHNVYISFTNDMIGKYTSIHYIGSWDVATGKQGYATSGIVGMECIPSGADETRCGNVQVDLAVGMLNGKVPLKRIVSVDVRTGNITRSKETGLYSELNFISLNDGGDTVLGYVVPEAEYNTMFVQLFLLGSYDKSRYAEVINMYPWGRVYEVK